MKFKNSLLSQVCAIILLSLISVSQAIDTMDIDVVRNKAVLEDKDLKVIDQFVADSVSELFNVKDFSSVGKIRLAIVSRSTSKAGGGEDTQYSSQFAESANKYIGAALKDVEKVTPPERKFKVKLNLLILVENLSDIRLIELAREKLNDPSMVIRYWAVRTVTNPAVIEKLNSQNSPDPLLAKELAGQLKTIAQNAEPEILKLIADFAVQINIPQGQELLLSIADSRIAKYASWQVDDESIDTEIVNLMCKKIALSQDRAALGSRLAQLLSYSMQRYIAGQDTLTDVQKTRLASMLAETEKSCLCITLSLPPQATIRTAIQQDDMTALMAEHNRLLGDEATSGVLESKLQYDYGRNADGSKKMGPVLLSKPAK